ncbi:MAG TPA: N-acetylglucosamine-6-phosphate deacetylase [Chitinophagaceae bacterium]|nr:N-acetylglucosamine-6-phosphate deacetylase [Chitinophagaceae bacterium]
MCGKHIKITNGRAITSKGIINNASVIIKGNCITEITGDNIDITDAGVINAGGRYISPGFIDIHVHGGGGHDFMDGTKQAFLQAAQLHAKYGTTALTPTTLTCSQEELIHILGIYEETVKEQNAGSRLMGMHLEGPYLAMSHKGAQDPRFIRNPDPKEYEEILTRFNCIARWSAAPELKGALQLGDYLKVKNILPAFAHTDAVYEEIAEALLHGYTHATHLYSAMNGVIRREAQRYAGAVEAAFLMKEITVEIIADGIHLPAPLLKLVYNIKGPHKTALITDAIRGAGMPEGESTIGSLHNGLPVIIEGGVAKLPDRSAFAGSVATADRLVRNMVNMAGIPLYDAVTMMSGTPARIMGFANKGSLSPGMDADIIIFDDDINIALTMVEGEIVYNKIVDAKY